MMNWILSSWGILKGEHGDFRRICMEMEAPVEEEKNDIFFGLTPLKNFIVIASYGQLIKLCK